MRRGGGAAGREEFARQWLEAQRDRRHAECARTRDRVAHQRAMAEMQAVEGADADHAALGAQRPAFDVTEQPAHGTREYSRRPALRLAERFDLNVPSGRESRKPIATIAAP